MPASTTVKAPETEIKVTKDATKQDLLAAYNKMAGEITTLNLSVDLVPSAGKAYSGIIQQYHEVSAFILAKRPAEVRMIGQVLSKNIFDMTSDGETFHIFIPSKNKFMVGSSTLERPAEKPIENIRPQHLLDALFWPEIPAAARIVMAEDDELTARYYVLSVLTSGASPEIERNLWFDRSDLHLARIQIYAAAGKLVSDIRLDSWQAAALPNFLSYRERQSRISTPYHHAAPARRLQTRNQSKESHTKRIHRRRSLPIAATRGLRACKSRRIRRR